MPFTYHTRHAFRLRFFSRRSASVSPLKFHSMKKHVDGRDLYQEHLDCLSKCLNLLVLYLQVCSYVMKYYTKRNVLSSKVVIASERTSLKDLNHSYEGRIVNNKRLK